MSLRPLVCVCVCTFRRAELLRRLLDALPKLDGLGTAFDLSCVVMDNDSDRSAETTVQGFARGASFPVSYHVEAERNFAVVRNRVVASASATGADLLAFIDDDEVPVPEWIRGMLDTLRAHKSDGVLAPVRPYFDAKPPRWLERSGLCDRPVHPTGMVMDWTQTRTGNVLIKRELFEPGGLRFDPAFRTGGEDKDFFKRAIAAGRRFVWCEEAPVYELVPPDRMTLRYHLRRALLQGTVSTRYDLGKRRLLGRMQMLVKSFIALVGYTLALPFLWIAQSPWCVRVLVKNCHHLARLACLCGVPLARERSF